MKTLLALQMLVWIKKDLKKSLTNHNNIVFLMPSLTTEPVSCLQLLCFSPAC